MSHKANIYPDIESLLLTIKGMKTKLAEAKIFRANYQTLLLMYKREKALMEGYKSWADKLERVVRDIAEDTASDAFDIRKFATKVLEARPKNVL